MRIGILLLYSVFFLFPGLIALKWLASRLQESNYQQPGLILGGFGLAVIGIVGAVRLNIDVSQFWSSFWSSLLAAVFAAAFLFSAVYQMSRVTGVLSLAGIHSIIFAIWAISAVTLFVVHFADSLPFLPVLKGPDGRVPFALAAPLAASRLLVGAFGILMLLTAVSRFIGMVEGANLDVIVNLVFCGLLLYWLTAVWSVYENQQANVVDVHRSPLQMSASDSGNDKSQTVPRTLIVVAHGNRGGQSMSELYEELKRMCVTGITDDRLYKNVDTQWLKQADVVALKYLSDRGTASLSNVDATQIVRGFRAKIRDEFGDSETRYHNVVLVGHSMGAVLLRKTFLYGANGCSDIERPNDDIEADQWTKKVSRIVLLAGINRGIDVSGRRPSDMSRWKYFSFWMAMWLGDLGDVGRLSRAMESGSPFISNLRMDWVRFFSTVDASKTRKYSFANSREFDVDPGLTTIQLLGDIDDVVRGEDEADLMVTAGANNRVSYFQIRVRGTGHSDIVRVGQSASQFDKTAEYRRQRFMLAVTGDHEMLSHKSEPLCIETQPDIKNVALVVHGIRDLGRWAAEFETALLPPAGQSTSWEIVSPRYGYFGMGPFLLASSRQQYVKWLMDQITEAYAQYPNARFDYFGHSNGTYLLAKALEDYKSLRVRTVVFAGSVVDRRFDWKSLLGDEKNERRVDRVLNYTAASDWVVAVFPRLFEQIPLRLIPNNPVGSGGFFGFRDGESYDLRETNTWIRMEGRQQPLPKDRILNVKIAGSHSAFNKYVTATARYLQSFAEPETVIQSAETAAAPAKSTELVAAAPEESTSATSTVPDQTIISQNASLTDVDTVESNDRIPSFALVPPLIMLLLIFLAVIVGVWLVSPARQFSTQVGLLYLVCVVWLLHKL